MISSLLGNTSAKSDEIIESLLTLLEEYKKKES